MDISLSLESAIRQSAIMQNESKSAAESVSKIDSKIPTKTKAKIQSVLDVLVNIIRRYVHLLIRNVSFVKTRDILQKPAERKLNQIYQLNKFQISFRKQLMRANLMKVFLRFTS